MDLHARTLDALDWPVVLGHLARHARTLRGKAAAERGDLADHRDAVLCQYAAVDELLLLQEAGDVLPVGAVTDVGASVDRAGRSRSLESGELRDIGGCLDALDRLRRWLDERGDDAPELHVLASPIQVDGALLDDLRESFESDGSLSGRRYPELGALREKSEALKSGLRDLLRDLVAGDRFGDALQDRFVTERNGRFVVPVRASYARSIGIVHAASQSGETLFVEPAEVVERTNKLKEVEQALEREERRILVQLTTQVAARQPEIQASLGAAERLDLVVARAGLGAELDGVIPEVGGGGVIALKQARHPVLQLRGIDVVANDLGVNDVARGLILSGPNTGGKTVALKTLGLAALMARAGVPIPALAGSRVDVFAPILADVGDLQSVEGDLSTFSGHVAVLKGMLAEAAPGALILLDEIGVGTDPAQGAALARAMLEALAARGARLAVTTHYAELKALGAADSGFALAAVQYADGRPTYRVEAGLAGQSHALAIAERLEMPADILARAREVMETTTREMTELMEELEVARAEADERARELAQAKQEMQAQTHRLRVREEKLEERRRTLKEEVARRFKEQLREREEQVKALIAALQHNPDLRLAGRTLKQLRAVKGDVQDEIEAQQEPLPPPPREVAVGDAVLVRNLGKVGEVTADLGRDRYTVRIGRLPMQVKLEDLAPADGRDAFRQTAPAPAPLPLPPPPPPTTGPLEGVRTTSNTCDLRGQRVEEALTLVDRFLSQLLERHLRVGFVLHGHGTGALKQAVRRALPTHPQVRRWRAAHPDEGGDAYTLVEI